MFQFLYYTDRNRFFLQQEEETDGAPRRRYNNNNSQQQQPQRVTMTRGVRGSRGGNARGSARGGATAPSAARRVAHQQRDEQQDGDATGADKRAVAATAARPTRGLYAPRGARRGGYEARNAVSELDI